LAIQVAIMRVPNVRLSSEHKEFHKYFLVGNLATCIILAVAWSRSLLLGLTQDDNLFFLKIADSGILENLKFGLLWPDYFRPLSTTPYFGFLYFISHDYKVLSLIGHLINLALLIGSAISLNYLSREFLAQFGFGWCLQNSFWLLPAFSMPMGWLSGYIDLSFYLFATLLLILIKKGNRHHVAFFALNLAILLTKESGLPLVFIFLIYFLRKRSLGIASTFMVPLLIYFMLNHSSKYTLHLDFDRLISLFKVFLHSGDRGIFASFLGLYLIVLVVFLSLRIYKSNQRGVAITLLIYALSNMGIFTLSSRPSNLDGYYLLPSIWAVVSAYAFTSSNASKFQFKTGFLVSFLALSLPATVLALYPPGMLSASEFQSQRSSSFFNKFGNNRWTMCLPPEGPWAALGYGAQIELFQNQIVVVSKDQKCDILFSGEDRGWMLGEWGSTSGKVANS